jgi:hypothetical protein
MHVAWQQAMCCVPVLMCFTVVHPAVLCGMFAAGP